MKRMNPVPISNLTLMRCLRLGALALLSEIAATGWAQATGSGAPGDRAFTSVFTQTPMAMPRYQQLDAPLLGNGDMGVAIGGQPEDQQFWLSKNDLWELRDVWRQSGPRPFGRIDLLIPGMKGASYHAEQDLANATTVSSFKNNNAEVSMRSWVCATENLLVVEMTAEGSPVSGEARLWIPVAAKIKQADHRPKPGMATDWLGVPAAHVFEDGRGTYWGTRGFRNDVEIPAEAACAFRLLGGNGERFKLEPGKPVILVAAMRSLRQSGDYLSEARERAASLDQEKLAPLYAGHVKWWRDFWDKSSVELGDAELEWRYHASNYILASCSRDPEYPPGIAGTWVTTDQPMWTGAYTLNYNHEACFYGLYSSNHIEQADPEDAPVMDFMKRGEYYAREVSHCRGVLYPVKIGPQGIETTGDPRNPDSIDGKQGQPWLRQKGGLFLGQRSDAAFAAVDMAQRWYTTYDLAYARRVYPFVRDVALFWEDYLKFEATPPAMIAATKDLPEGLRQPADGRYVIYNDGASEGGQDTNPAVSLSLVRNVLKLAQDMGGALGEDAKERAKWQYIQRHLSGYSTMDIGGKTLFSMAEQVGPGTRKPKGISPTLLWRKSITPIYPSGVVGLGSDPRLLEIARNTFAGMKTWVSMNGCSSVFPSAARIGWDPNVILAQLLALKFQPNGIVYNEFHMLENSSVVPNTIDEMLLQSHEGILRLFPVWPMQRNARFRTLRAYGAFLISAALSGGTVKDVVIFSEKGRPCAVQNPWPGRRVQLAINGNRTQTLDGERLSFDTKPGDQIELIPDR